LNAIGNNFNQTVKKLHTLDHLPEFKSWIIMTESGRQILAKKIEEIKEKTNQIYQQWLQK
jgi:ABC-type phosphate/phosphonate transport system ATPase subunit